MVAMRELCIELSKGNRGIVTNMPVRLDPWVNGAGKPMIGLVEYMRRKGVDSDETRRRVRLIPDDEGGTFTFGGLATMFRLFMAKTVLALSPSTVRT